MRHALSIRNPKSQLQRSAAVFAIFGIRIVPFGAALRTGLGGYGFLVRLGQLGGDDSGGHGNDSVADDHDQGRQSLAETRMRCYITVPDCCHGYNGPVNALWNARESALRIFDDVHQRTKNNDQRKYDKQKDGYFAAAGRMARIKSRASPTYCTNFRTLKIRRTRNMRITKKYWEPGKMMLK